MSVQLVTQYLISINNFMDHIGTTCIITSARDIQIIGYEVAASTCNFEIHHEDYESFVLFSFDIGVIVGASHNQALMEFADNFNSKSEEMQIEVGVNDHICHKEVQIVDDRYLSDDEAKTILGGVVERYSSMITIIENIMHPTNASQQSGGIP